MQASVASSVVAAPGPLFATVTFVGEDNRKGSTFRVPISASTTVRRLAKDAMQRLVLSRRSLDGCSKTPAIVVTEVFVGGTGAQPKAEVFAQDCVMQVVLVKDEIVYMRVKGISMSVALPRRSSPPAESRQSCESPAAGGVIAARSDHGAPLTASTAAPSLLEEAVPLRDGAMLPTTLSCPAPGTAALVSAAARSLEERAAVQKSRSDDANAAVSPIGAEPPAPNAESRRLRRGWGPGAYELFPENYVSSPGKRPRAIKPRKKTTTVPADKLRRTEPSTTAAAGTRGREEVVSLDRQTLQDKRLGWGPEASKHFPDNYVSSPQKLARHQRAQRQCASTSARNTLPALPAALTKPAPKEPVSRVLQYPTAEGKEGRTTVGHAVEDAIVVDEASPTVELPKGWGKESIKFFDPNTYCDDPAKARLLPNMDYSRSRRERHLTSL
ncbi:hypothetical protein JKF63_03125 [Porcisia hertigi]|uniref:Uncharacterized protein n=1 Tax=Porcisia hertigi TaxID=2761500 RepID=A0A836IJ56_9TRYP|nr:hypothetical protein JKF63_03125 [Porcisia hertigi]